MTQSIIRWTLAAGGLFLVGPMLAWIVGQAPAPDGHGIVTPMLSTTPVMGVLLWLLASLGAGLYGIVCARLTTWRFAMACVGFALVWTAWSTPRLDDLVRMTDVDAPIVGLAVDGLLIALPAAMCAMLIARRAPTRTTPQERSPAQGAGGLAIFALAAMAAGWALARDERVGQTVASALVAGIAGAAAGRAFAPHLRPGLLVLAIPLTAALAPVVGLLVGGGALQEQVFGGEVFALLRVMPADWTVGLCIGLPIGAAQADHVIERHLTDVSTGSPARTANPA